MVEIVRLARGEHYASGDLSPKLCSKINQHRREIEKDGESKLSSNESTYESLRDASRARLVFDKLKDQLMKFGVFNTEEFIDDLRRACRCANQRATSEMISVLWHATKDPSLVYYCDKANPRTLEFEFYIAQAYGVKKYRHSSHQRASNKILDYVP